MVISVEPTFDEFDCLTQHLDAGAGARGLFAEEAAEDLAARLPMIETEYVPRDIRKPAALFEVMFRVRYQSLENFGARRGIAGVAEYDAIDVR